MKVLVTGHLGYIGVHLVDVLKREGHTVTGCDIGLFSGCELEPFTKPDRELLKDVGELTLNEVEGHDAICHLAAISNDPMGDIDPALTLTINRDASVDLARKAKVVGVDRFLFSGSCSVYGGGEKLDLEETDALNPLTAYARSKIEAEELIGDLTDDNFCPVYLRNATAYGHSPMLRMDLVVNNLLGSALAYGEIRIMSDGSPWRPLIHCRDIARAFVAFMDADRSAIRNQAINVGANRENYQVKDIGNLVKAIVPNSKVAYTGEVGADPRNYRVCFDKLAERVPDFRLEYNLERGMIELHEQLVSQGFCKEDFEGDRFVRLRTLRHRLSLLPGVSHGFTN